MAIRPIASPTYRLATSVLFAALLVGVAMLWTGDSAIRETIQAPLWWLMMPGILVGFATGSHHGHDFQWPYWIAATANFVLHAAACYSFLSALAVWRQRRR